MPDHAGEPSYWVWVTRPDYYLDEDGNDREELDPDLQEDAGDWWTCHRDTRRGDLVFLYRSRLRKDLGYLIQAESDAQSLADDPYAVERNWDYGCDYRVLYKFDDPLTLAEMRADPYLDDWGALRAYFRRRVYAIPDEIREHLISTLKRREKRFSRFLRSGGLRTLSSRILLEEELEQKIADDPSILRPFGYDLEIRERQLICSGGHGGRIDLLAWDRKEKRYVVIELKNVRAGQNTFGQISTYVGWVEQNISKRRRAEGLVIARGFDHRFESAVATTTRIAYIDLADLGFA